MNGDIEARGRRSVHRCRRGRDDGHVSSPTPPPRLHGRHTTSLRLTYSCPLVLLITEGLTVVWVICYGREGGAGRWIPLGGVGLLTV